MERYVFSNEQRQLLEGLQQAFAVYQFIDKRVVTLILSDGFCELFGYENRAIAYHDMDHDMYKDVHPGDVARISDAAVRFATKGGSYEVIYRTRKLNEPGYQIIHAMGAHVITETGVQLAHIWYMSEGSYVEDAVTNGSELNRKLANALREESIIKDIKYDYLTGLPNMSYFFDLAEIWKETYRREKQNPVLLYFDIAGMKFYNSSHGFSAGDQLLRSFSRVLIETFNSENCGHAGGGHFVVCTTGNGIGEVLRQLFEKCQEPEAGIPLPVRVGIYPSAIEDVPVSIACDRAKLACEAIHNRNVSGYSCYDIRLRDETLLKQYIISNLDRAMENGWIQVFYQPIVRAVNGHVCDEEALARWIDPEKGLLSPDQFIPHLESADLIHKLDLYVLEQVLLKMRRQKVMGLTLVPHSVNLSRSDFDACDIVEEFCKRVDAANIPRDLITVEVTESIVGRDFEFMKKQIARFREQGFAVWMDDFGSGYSSLDVLQSVTFDLIKFDMSFMKKLDEGDQGKIILTELMKMATTLGVDTVCEGVETESQVRFLREIGCAKLQGWYYCKAISLEEIRKRYEAGIQIGYENPEEAAYYDAMGRVNLYDYAVIAKGEDSDFQRFFNTLPMGIIEVRGDTTRFVRSNVSYRDFIRRSFHLDLSSEGSEFTPFRGSFMKHVVEACTEEGSRTFFDETLPDGSRVHSFARRIGVNPVKGTFAIAVVVLSVTEHGNNA